jgi:hypothetical protein
MVEMNGSLGAHLVNGADSGPHGDSAVDWSTRLDHVCLTHSGVRSTPHWVPGQGWGLVCSTRGGVRLCLTHSGVGLAPSWVPCQGYRLAASGGGPR